MKQYATYACAWNVQFVILSEGCALMSFYQSTSIVSRYMYTIFHLENIILMRFQLCNSMQIIALSDIAFIYDWWESCV